VAGDTQGGLGIGQETRRWTGFLQQRRGAGMRPRHEHAGEPYFGGITACLYASYRMAGDGSPEAPRCGREVLPARWGSGAPVQLPGFLLCRELGHTPLFRLSSRSPAPLNPLLSASTQALGRVRSGSRPCLVM